MPQRRRRKKVRDEDGDLFEKAVEESEMQKQQMQDADGIRQADLKAERVLCLSGHRVHTQRRKYFVGGNAKRV